MAARSKDPEKRRGLRAKVASDIKGRIKQKIAKAQVGAYDAARKAGLSQEILNSYEIKLIERQYRNNPYKVMLEKALVKHKPFNDKTEQAVVMILTNRSNDDYDKVLWENWSKIREVIEREYEDFPYLNDQRQAELLRQIVLEINDSILYLEPLTPVIDLNE